MDRPRTAHIVLPLIFVTRIVNYVKSGVFRCRLSKHALVGAFFAGLILLHALPLHSEQGEEWLANLRREIDAHHLTAALEIADQRLAVAPGDTDARGWRARTLASLGRTQEAELEFRAVLAVTPNDPDVLSGLAGVLVREQRRDEALLLLDQAIALDPARADILDQRGTLLRSVGRPDQARLDFQAELARSPTDEHARAEVDSLRPEPRHEFYVGSDTDTFNYTGAANAETLALTSHWNTRWTTSFSGILYQRFGADAGKFAGSISRRLGRNNSLTLGGAVAHDQGVIPRSEAFATYGHGFALSETHLFRAIETDFQSHWYWYQDARVLGLTSTATLYLPREWNFLLAVTEARSAFSNPGADWRPSGVAKISIPLRRQITANVFFAVGTENFAQADQIGSFSARTFGSGAKYQFSRRQNISFYVAYQARSQGRTQTSFGVGYGFLF